MEFADIMYGLVGFLAMFAGFCVIRMLYHGVLRLLRHLKERSRQGSVPKRNETAYWEELLFEETENDETK